MKQINKSESLADNRQRKPALTPEERENELIALSLDCVEERIRNRTATAQELIHFLKLASTKEQIERQKLEEEVELLRSKTKALESSERVEKLYSDAIKAMSIYSGNISSNDSEEEDYDSYIQ